MSTVPAVLILEDGRISHGEAYGAVGTTFGEAVFSTGMSGYQETLTDPSYHRQVVIMTAPHIGNTGVNDEDAESGRIWVSGYVVRDPSRIASNWRATRGLEDQLTEQASPGMAGADLTDDVSTASPYVVPAVGERKFTVAAIDLGIKAMTPYRMAERGIEVHVMPASSTVAQIKALSPDGVFYANGPGDPATADYQVEVMQAFLADRTPVFGICFGNQVLGRALGLGTYKLGYGHRGINQPVKDLATGRVAVTAHNHGFAVDAPRSGEFDTPFGAARVSHVCLNDDVVEGLRCLDVPAFSVQYHPEAAAGPHDASYLFDDFIALMDGTA